jgi:thiol:disulfide interchange protein DsbD
MRWVESWSKHTLPIVLGLTGLSSLYAKKLKPVSWSLQTDQGMVAPGSSVVLRLHAQIDDGYHLYSFTTPARGPIKTTVSLEPSPDIKGIWIYQRDPDRHLDPNLNVPVETFTNSVDFLLRIAIASGAARGEKVVTARVRYQACSNEICLPPATRIATTSIEIGHGKAAPIARIPLGYHLVDSSTSSGTPRPPST